MEISRRALIKLLLTSTAIARSGSFLGSVAKADDDSELYADQEISYYNETVKNNDADAVFAESASKNGSWRDGGTPNLDGRIPGLFWLDPMQASAVNSQSDEDRLARNYGLGDPTRHFNSFGDLAPEIEKYFDHGYVDSIPTDILNAARSRPTNVGEEMRLGERLAPADIRSFFANRPDLTGAVFIAVAPVLIDRIASTGNFSFPAIPLQMGSAISAEVSLGFQNWTQLNSIHIGVDANYPLKTNGPSIEFNSRFDDLNTTIPKTSYDLTIRVGF
ncbi:hypothetical protein [Rhizobium sp. BR 362]|uniref:hypothetical protein n=1 Tax=Rhizobium sp. BR 362 TaxID=3040670 RepID=UPI002F3EE826